MPLFKIYDKSHKFAKQQYNMNTQKHSNTNLLQSNIEEAIKAQKENIIIIITNVLTHQVIIPYIIIIYVLVSVAPPVKSFLFSATY